MRTLAQATGRRDRGRRAGRAALPRASTASSSRCAARPRPRVAALEWLDPVYVAGHWTPQLIELAGGEDVLGLPGEPSQTVTWEDVAARAAARSSWRCPAAMTRRARTRRRSAYAGELERARMPSGSSRSTPSAYFSRPGPRLIDGLELLAHILHPDELPSAPGEALPVELAHR